MKVLYINYLYKPYIGGGAEITLNQLVNGIKKRGHDVRVLTLHDGNNSVELIDNVMVYRKKISNIYHPFFNSKHNTTLKIIWHCVDIYNPFIKKYLNQLLERFCPDIISVHNLPGWSCSVWNIIYKKNIPFIQVLHDHYLLCPKNMYNNNHICEYQCQLCKIFRYICKNESVKASGVVGVSKYILDKHINNDYFIDVKNKYVINNVRSINKNEILLRKYDGIINYGYIGGITKNKGIEILLYNFIKIKDKNKRLYIAGIGDKVYYDKIKTEYNDPQIIFMGHVDRLDFFNIIDVTIVPSLWGDPFPGVVFESLIFGIPVIGADVGGISEMIVHGENGYIYKNQKQLLLSELMLRIEKEINEWKEKSVSIKLKAAKYSDYDKWIGEWVEFYKYILLNK